MEALRILATPATPEVNFDAEACLMTLTGESYPENAFEFFRPLLKWTEGFLMGGDQPVKVELALSYLNTSSIKSIMDFLDLLEAAHRRARPITVTWSYAQDNERALEMIEEFKEEVTLPFFILAVPV